MKTVRKSLNRFLLLHLNTKTKAKAVKPDMKMDTNLRNIENFENKLETVSGSVKLMLPAINVADTTHRLPHQFTDVTTHRLPHQFTDVAACGGHFKF
jgi:hypothetical protein